jgi:hypothetical protein
MPARHPFPFRHVHLDFHTSPLITDVGVDFDGEEFAGTLLDAGVNSICVFARCHHGMSYFPSSVGPMHPGLSRDLMGEQIEACKRHGINVTAYTTVVWDEHSAIAHPEWRQVDRSGRPVGRGPVDLSHRWRFLCMNTSYVDYLAAHTEELLRGYEVDGLFVDIVFQQPPGCVCERCVASMRELRLDPTSDADLRHHSRLVERGFMAQMTDLVWGIRPGLPLFYNSRLRLTADPADGNGPELQHQTHLEIESLPSGGWGYNHFPLFVRYYQTQGIPHLGHTGRFHRSWGDFGGLKPRAALEYECFRMLSSGSTCCVGDQLHPRGALDAAVYRRIGEVYNQVAEVESWCADAEPLADVGVLLAATIADELRQGDLGSEEGAMRLLLELHQQFQFVDRDADFGRYRLLILPDAVEVDPPLHARLDAFVAAGGALLVTGSSGLSADAPEWSTLGVRWEGPAPYQPEYVQLEGALADAAPAMPHVVYERGERVAALAGAEMLGRVGTPYFNRTPFTYSSHEHAPVERITEAPAVVRNGRTAYCAYPLFRAYRRWGNQSHKQIVAGLIHMLLPEPLLRIEAPSTAEATLLRQQVSGETRLVAHLLHYVPQRRADNLDLVEDVIPLHDLALALRTDAPTTRAFLAPQGSELTVDHRDGYASVVVPRVEGHKVVVFAP